jgi:outer membrane murein-binding lipoprotein Lpp
MGINNTGHFARDVRTFMPDEARDVQEQKDKVNNMFMQAYFSNNEAYKEELGTEIDRLGIKIDSLEKALDTMKEELQANKAEDDKANVLESQMGATAATLALLKEAQANMNAVFDA